MSTLSEKLARQAEDQKLTGPEIEFQSRLLGTRISAPLWYKIVNTGFSDISRPRLLVLSQICGLPIRFLADDSAESPLDAVKLEAARLSESDKRKLILYIQQDIKNG